MAENCDNKHIPSVESYWLLSKSKAFLISNINQLYSDQCLDKKELDLVEMQIKYHEELFDISQKFISYKKNLGVNTWNKIREKVMELTSWELWEDKLSWLKLEIRKYLETTEKELDMYRDIIKSSIDFAGFNLIYSDLEKLFIETFLIIYYDLVQTRSKGKIWKEKDSFLRLSEIELDNLLSEVWNELRKNWYEKSFTLENIEINIWTDKNNANEVTKNFSYTYEPYSTEYTSNEEEPKPKLEPKPEQKPKPEPEQRQKPRINLVKEILKYWLPEDIKTIIRFLIKKIFAWVIPDNLTEEKIIDLLHN